MSRHDFNNVTEIVMKTAKSLYDNEKFFIGQLAAKANKIAQANPHDQTSVAFSNFLKKRANSSNTVFITRSELKQVYDKLYYPNNKIAQHFKDELGLAEKPKLNLMQRDPKEGENLVDNAYEKCADQILSEQLSDAFNKKPIKRYSSNLAKRAQKACASELNLCGALPKKVDVVAGQEDLLICRATYDTPKGQSHVLVPVEIRNSRVLMPSFFLSTAGFVELNSKLIKDHLTNTAGSSYKVDVQKLLKVLSDAKNGTSVKPISDVERIVMKTAAAKETPASHAFDGIICQTVDPESPNLDTPKLEDTAKFADKLSSDAGLAELTFGKKLIDRGRGLIQHELMAAGHKNAQISVSNATVDSVTYAVSVGGKFGFNVPMKISNGTINSPNVIVASGRVFEFTPIGISNMLSTGDTDPHATAQASPLYGIKPSELVENIRTAMANSNYAKAEDALHVLKISGDAVAYQAGYSAFVNGLSGKNEITKEASDTPKCKAPIKTSTSKYMLCSHTGLPLHKVFQDDNGNCSPLYRKGMTESSEGASFLHSRVYFE